MIWRRVIFFLVYLSLFPFLLVGFVTGYMAEGVMRQIETLDRWSRRVTQ